MSNTNTPEPPNLTQLKALVSCAPPTNMTTNHALHTGFDVGQLTCSPSLTNWHIQLAMVHAYEALNSVLKAKFMGLVQGSDKGIVKGRIMHWAERMRGVHGTGRQQMCERMITLVEER